LISYTISNILGKSIPISAADGSAITGTGSKVILVDTTARIKETKSIRRNVSSESFPEILKYYPEIDFIK
jgi:hypothetical protein